MKTFDETSQYIMKKFYRVEGDSPARLRFKRNNLGGLFKELGFKIGAEIGVHKGTYSEVLCQGNPEMELYCIDPWTVYESEGVDEPFAQNQEALDGFYEEAKKRLALYHCNIIRKPSMEAVKDFKPGDLDFIYLDANHDFKHVTEDIAAWAEIVRSGGIVAGHDYGHFKRRDQGQPAIKAIDNYVRDHGIKMLFLVNQNYQTTWFFIKG
jgi:hypothetical protein